ncbi:MAG: flagellar biosynthetic protein FliO [Bacteroidales bacterium]|nr:flagellar biosynthetic protein FliO [Bacteroidales bacterium]MCM1415616.1 flagellar biosynthetic protein FliO [bacterium]MCM1423009.1 flagellar biosynthetic protein FliO [bacterium]
MLLALPDRTDSYVQFITVLLLFVFVLAVTALVTRWIGGYQKGKSAGMNMELLEAIRLSNNKYIQLVRIGRKYLALAVCKDTVTMLSEIPEDQLQFSEGSSSGMSSFKDVLNKIQREKILEKEDGRDE